MYILLSNSPSTFISAVQISIFWWVVEARVETSRIASMPMDAATTLATDTLISTPMEQKYSHSKNTQIIHTHGVAIPFYIMG